MLTTKQKDKYQTQFNHASTLIEKLKLAKDLAREKDFKAADPTQMNYHTGDEAILVDVDETLLYRHIVPNQSLITALKESEKTNIYLFTRMSVSDLVELDNHNIEDSKLKVGDPNNLTRVELIAYLTLSGIQVRGVITPQDAALGKGLGGFYTRYYGLWKQALEYSIIENQKRSSSSKKRSKKIPLVEELNQLNEDVRQDSGSVLAGADQTLYGCKKQIFEFVCHQNTRETALSTVWFFDDDRPNQLGLLTAQAEFAAQGREITLHVIDTAMQHEYYQSIYGDKNLGAFYKGDFGGFYFEYYNQIKQREKNTPEENQADNQLIYTITTLALLAKDEKNKATPQITVILMLLEDMTNRLRAGNAPKIPFILAGLNKILEEVFNEWKSKESPLQTSILEHLSVMEQKLGQVSAYCDLPIVYNIALRVNGVLIEKTHGILQQYRESIKEKLLDIVVGLIGCRDSAKTILDEQPIDTGSAQLSTEKFFALQTEIQGMFISDDFDSLQSQLADMNVEDPKSYDLLMGIKDQLEKKAKQLLAIEKFEDEFGLQQAMIVIGNNHKRMEAVQRNLDDYIKTQESLEAQPKSTGQSEDAKLFTRNQWFNKVFHQAWMEKVVFLCMYFTAAMKELNIKFANPTEVDYRKHRAVFLVILREISSFEVYEGEYKAYLQANWRANLHDQKTPETFEVEEAENKKGLLDCIEECFQQRLSYIDLSLDGNPLMEEISIGMEKSGLQEAYKEYIGKVNEALVDIAIPKDEEHQEAPVGLGSFFYGNDNDNEEDLARNPEDRRDTIFDTM